jgi:hypothetical protein
MVAKKPCTKPDGIHNWRLLYEDRSMTTHLPKLGEERLRSSAWSNTAPCVTANENAMVLSFALITLCFSSQLVQIVGTEDFHGLESSSTESAATICLTVFSTAN